MHRRALITGVAAMGLFSSSTRAMSGNDDSLMVMLNRQEDDKSTQALLERLAKEAESEALAKHAEVLRACQEEHERQAAGYQFECRRFGDFLSVFVTRNGNFANGTANFQRKFSTSVNIATTKEIKVVAGNAADDLGELTYYPEWHGGSDPSVKPKYPEPPPARSSFNLELPSSVVQSGYSFGVAYFDGRFVVRFTTKPYARISVDDQIVFSGIGATIYAPSGLGEYVRDTILKEFAAAVR